MLRGRLHVPFVCIVFREISFSFNTPSRASWPIGAPSISRSHNFVTVRLGNRSLNSRMMSSLRLVLGSKMVSSL